MFSNLSRTGIHELTVCLLLRRFLHIATDCRRFEPIEALQRVTRSIGGDRCYGRCFFCIAQNNHNSLFTMPSRFFVHGSDPRLDALVTDVAFLKQQYISLLSPTTAAPSLDLFPSTTPGIDTSLGAQSKDYLDSATKKRKVVVYDGVSSVDTEYATAADTLLLSGGTMTGPITNLTTTNTTVSLGSNASTSGANSVNIGNYAGDTGGWCVNVGDRCGDKRQALAAVAIGRQAGENDQSQGGLAIGQFAAQNTQGTACIAIGDLAGQNNQNPGAIAIGGNAGKTSQGDRSVAVGLSAGVTSQGVYAVAAGYKAGETNQHAYSIVLNADSVARNTTANDEIILHTQNTELKATSVDLEYNGNVICTNAGALTAPSDFVYNKGWAEAYADGMSNVTACVDNTTDYVANFGTDILNQTNGAFAVSTAGRLTYIGTRTRYFHMGISISFEDNKNAVVDFSLHKNGTHLPGSEAILSVNTASASTAIHKIVSLATNDYVELFVKSSINNTDVTVTHANLFALGLPNTV